MEENTPTVSLPSRMYFVRRGIAKAVPEKIELTEAELVKIIKRAANDLKLTEEDDDESDEGGADGASAAPNSLADLNDEFNFEKYDEEETKIYNKARLHLRKAEETSDLDSDDEVMKRKRKKKKVYSPEDLDSSDDCPILKTKNVQPNLKYPTPPKHISTVTRKNLTTQEVKDITEIFDNVTNSTVKTDPNPPVNCPCDCILSKQFAIQQNHLIQVVTDLSNQMDELHRKLDLLLARSGESLNQQVEDTFTVPDFLTNLPVKDDASFCLLNDQLKISQNKEAIIKYLAGIGGRNVRSLTTNMLRRILLDEVAELYSLTGKQMKNSNKKSFLTTETCKIIFKTCKKIYDDVTEEKLKGITSDWLNQAKVRIIRRAERQNKAQGSEA